ncbi:hypothetical protein Tco_1564815, partial [Tanacetum coccineum]
TDYEYAERLQEQESENIPEEERENLWVELLRKRQKILATKKVEAKRNKPMTQAQQRSYMCNYLKNMARWKISQLKSYSDEEIVRMFNNAVNSINNFVDFRQDLIKESSKTAADDDDSSRKRDNYSNVKYPIIDWDIYKEDTRQYWKIIRVGYRIEMYKFFSEMLLSFDRQDLQDLWNLVKDRYSSTQPTEDMDRMLWTELKRMFEPDLKDEVWKYQHGSYTLMWKLYETCGVHQLFTKTGIIIYMLVEKEYPLSQGLLTLMLSEKLIVDHECEMAFELIRFIQGQIRR